jgi:acyl-CoA thioester hydrolase
MITPPFLTPLNGASLRSAGITEPWSYGMADRVRFGEIDALNHVNNVVYLRWYETLRVTYLHDYGIYDHAGPNPKFVVKTVGLDYKAEVHLGARYINVARTTQMRNTSFTMQYATRLTRRPAANLHHPRRGGAGLIAGPKHRELAGNRPRRRLIRPYRMHPHLQ